MTLTNMSLLTLKDTRDGIRNDSTSSSNDSSSDSFDDDDTLLYHMEKKYLQEDQDVDSYINFVSFFLS